MRQRQPAWLRLLPWVPALVAVLLLLAVGFSLQSVVGDTLTQRAASRVELTARQYADSASRVLGRGAAQLSALTRAAALASGSSPAAMREELERVRASLPVFVWLGVTDAQGQVLAATQGLLEGGSIATRPVYLQGRLGPWFGSLHPPTALGPAFSRLGQPVPAALADLAMPLLDGSGRLRGVLVAHLDGGYFDALLQRTLGPEATRDQLALALVDERGQVVVGALPAAALHWSVAASGAVATATAGGQPVRPGEQTAMTPQTANMASTASTAQAPDRAQDVVVARSPLPQPDIALQLTWSAVAAQPLAATLAPVAALQQRLLVGGGALALLLGGVGVALSRWLARPAQRLFEQLSERLGQPQPGADGRTPDQLQLLFESLDQLPLPDAQASPAERLLAQGLRDASRLRATLMQMPAPVFLLDVDLRVVFWNRAAEQTFSCPEAHALGQPVAQLLPGTALDPDGTDLAQRMPLEPGPWRFEATVRRPDSAPVHGEWRLSKVQAADGSFLGVLAQVLDRSAEHAAEQRLHEQRQTLAAIIHSASDAVISTDAGGRIQLFNPAAERIFGHRAADMLDQGLDRLLPEAERPRHQAHLAAFSHAAITRRRMGTGRVQGRHANGQALELEASISQARVAGRVVLTAILRDVTARVQAEAALMQMQAELSELTQRLLVQEQAMMRRMAQTLHDRLGQTLTALRLTLEASPARSAGGQHEQARLERAMLLTDQAVAEVRRALMELRPPLLEDQGLAPALANELRLREAELPGVDLLLELGRGADSRWPPEVEYAVFMVAREALANAQRHAGASLVRVLLSGDTSRLSLEVLDDGRGLPAGGGPSAGQLGPQAKPGHLGLVGMRERVQVIGAKIAFESQPGQGTRVRLQWHAPAAA